jgi:hypothetical protein
MSAHGNPQVRLAPSTAPGAVSLAAMRFVPRANGKSVLALVGQPLISLDEFRVYLEFLPKTPFSPVDEADVQARYDLYLTRHRVANPEPTHH